VSDLPPHEIDPARFALVVVPSDRSDPKRLVVIALEGQTIPEAQMVRRPHQRPDDHPG